MVAAETTQNERHQVTITPDSLMTFGKHAGKPLREVPRPWLNWWHSQNKARRDDPLVQYIERPLLTDNEETKKRTPREYARDLVARHIINPSQYHTILTSVSSVWGTDGKCYGMSFDPVTQPELLDKPSMP